MAVGLLLSAFAKNYSKEELYLQQKFKERLADLHATVGEVSFRTCFSDRVESQSKDCQTAERALRVEYLTVTVETWLICIRQATEVNLGSLLQLNYLISSQTTSALMAPLIHFYKSNWQISQRAHYSSRFLCRALWSPPPPQGCGQHFCLCSVSHLFIFISAVTDACSQLATLTFTDTVSIFNLNDIDILYPPDVFHQETPYPLAEADKFSFSNSNSTPLDLSK